MHSLVIPIVSYSVWLRVTSGRCAKILAAPLAVYSKLSLKVLQQSQNIVEPHCVTTTKIH